MVNMSVGLDHIAVDWHQMYGFCDKDSMIAASLGKNVDILKYNLKR